MSEKVKVPNEVAAALDFFVNLADTKSEAFTDILSFGFESPRSEIILRHFDGNHDELMQALICGYIVAETQADMVRDFYNAERHDKVNLFYQCAIKGTLDRLGIKIEGVNAE